MLYQSFKRIDGVMTRFGPVNGSTLESAILRAAKFNGEVRPLGSLQVVWMFKVDVAPQPMQANRAYWPEPKRIPAPRFVNSEGESVQSSAFKYHPSTTR